MRKLFILITFLVLAISNANATKVIRILAIGNSFSEDAVEQYLYDLGKDAGYELIIGNAYRGGQGLESHWKEAMSDGNSFEYRKIIQGKKYNRHHQTLKSIITDESWDYITLQQVSQDSGNPDTYEPFLTNLIAYVKSLATNDRMKLGFHMTWAYSGDSTHSGRQHHRSLQVSACQSSGYTLHRAERYCHSEYACHSTGRHHEPRRLSP